MTLLLSLFLGQTCRKPFADAGVGTTNDGDTWVHSWQVVVLGCANQRAVEPLTPKNIQSEKDTTTYFVKRALLPIL